MKSLKLNPLNLPGGWATLFDSKKTAEAFAEQWTLVQRHFKPLCQGQCQRKTKGRGFAIGKPVPWLYLMYLCASKPSRNDDTPEDEPYLAARFYINSVEHTLEMNTLQRERMRELEMSGRVVRSYPMARPAPSSMPKDVKLSREFRTPLLPLLELEKPALRQELLNFAGGVFDHTRAAVESA